MIGIIVLPGPSPAMHGLDQHAPLSLLPLGDRPILQHAIELLVLEGITQFEFILEHAPERVEEYLGDGTRWGCKFRYHLSTDSDRPYRTLRGRREFESETLLLIHGDHFPYTHFAAYCDSAKPVLFVANELSNASGWRESAIFPSGSLSGKILDFTNDELGDYFKEAAARGDAETATVEHWIDARSPASLLRTQDKLMNRTFTDLMIGGTEGDPGIWISRNVTIHPSVKIVSPVYLGPNCRLRDGAEIGPNAVISKNCMVDGHTIVRNALITPGSYIGEHLELDEVIVDRNLLASAKFDTSVSIQEDFLLGRLTDSPRGNPLASAVQSIFALVLLVVLSPLWLTTRLTCFFSSRQKWISRETVKLPAASDPRFWKTFGLSFTGTSESDPPPQAGWRSFLTRFVPGLPAVLFGQLSLVGLPPRSSEEILKLPADWRTLYLNGRAGLVTEFALTPADSVDENAIYFAEAFHIASKSRKSDAIRLLRYFLQLIVPSRSHADEFDVPADRSVR